MLVRSLSSYFRRWIQIVCKYPEHSVDIASSSISRANTHQRSSCRHDLLSEQPHAAGVAQAAEESVRLHSLMNIHRIYAFNALNRHS